MARRPRRETIDPDRCRIYHVYTRCVHRQALLSSENDEYKILIYQLFRLLDEHFAVDVCAYDILDNHLHLVIRLTPERVEEWSDREVVVRWGASHPPRGKPPTERWIEKHLADEVWVEKHREALASPSQFMKDLKQRVAQHINAAEGLEGHFWQGRFGARAIESTEDLLAVCAYVDLNDVKAGLCDDPRMAEFCSAAERARALKRDTAAGEHQSEQTWLVPIADPVPRNNGSSQYGSQRRGMFRGGSIGAYLGLLRELARIIREGRVRSTAGGQASARRLGDEFAGVIARVQDLFEDPRWSPG